MFSTYLNFSPLFWILLKFCERCQPCNSCSERRSVLPLLFYFSPTSSKFLAQWTENEPWGQIIFRVSYLLFLNFLFSFFLVRCTPAHLPWFCSTFLICCWTCAANDYGNKIPFPVCSFLVPFPYFPFLVFFISSVFFLLSYFLFRMSFFYLISISSRLLFFSSIFVICCSTFARACCALLHHLFTTLSQFRLYFDSHFAHNCVSNYVLKFFKLFPTFLNGS